MPGCDVTSDQGAKRLRRQCPKTDHSDTTLAARSCDLLRTIDALRGEAAQRAADVAFAKPLERAVAQLANAFTGDAEHGADLLERVLAPTFEAEVQAQHLRIARRQRAQRASRSRR